MSSPLHIYQGSSSISVGLCLAPILLLIVVGVGIPQPPASIGLGIMYYIGRSHRYPDKSRSGVRDMGTVHGPIPFEHMYRVVVS